MSIDSAAGFWSDAEIISAYTRADALRDGVLVAVPGDLARELGIRVPVAVTTGVWGAVTSPRPISPTCPARM